MRGNEHHWIVEGGGALIRSPGLAGVYLRLPPQGQCECQAVGKGSHADSRTQGLSEKCCIFTSSSVLFRPLSSVLLGFSFCEGATGLLDI